MDPGADGTFPVSDITAEITQQTGSLYQGTLSLTQPGGDPLLLDIEGTVDAEGLTEGISFPPGVPMSAGEFTGRFVGSVLTLSVKVANPTCEADASSFIGTRG
jgi:hypothetical protein